MAGLENLFAAEPMLPSVQTTKLPDDSQQWAEVITTKLRERYPEVTRLPLTVEFRRKDEQSGTALGSVHVADPESKKTIYIPVIIKKFELFPLDIWMEGKTQAVHPLNNDTFKEQFFVQSPAEGLDNRPQDSAGQYFNDPSLWTSNYPPLQGRYSYASAGYTLLDAIEDTITKEDLDAFKKSLEKQAYLLPKFQKTGRDDVISKLAKKSVVNTNDFVASAAKLIPTGATSIKREGYDKYSILSMADQLFDLAASENVDRNHCHNYLSKITAKPWDFLHEVDQQGEKMLLVKAAPKEGVFLYDDIRFKPEVANDFAVYAVRNQTGMDLKGLVVPHVVNFAGKKQGSKLFLSPEHSSMQSSIAGVKLDESDQFLKILKPVHGARVGQTGTFMFVDDGKAIATIPVTIKAIEEYGPMTAITLDGTKIKIKRGYSDNPSEGTNTTKGKKDPKFLDVHGMIEDRPNEYTIPRSMMWIPMEGFQEVSSSTSDWLHKEASTKMDMDPLVIRWTGIVFDVNGAGMEKVSLDERRTKLLLAVRGASLDKVAQVIKKARAAGKVKVHNLKPLRKKADIVKLAEDTHGQLKGLCAMLKADLLKVAAEIEDATTVDVLLSLNFVNPDNLSKFISYRPVFEKVLDYLAELTLASRLGTKDLSEAALVTAMSKVEEVIDGLKRMQSGLKKPGIKTAAAAAGPSPVGKGEDPFADGMADGEMQTHMFLDKWRKDPKAMLAYMNGKRLAEQNKATSAMSAGFQPPNGMKPMKPQAPAKAGGKK